MKVAFLALLENDSSGLYSRKLKSGIYFDYSGYHKNRSQKLFYYTVNEKKIIIIMKSCFCFFID